MPATASAAQPLPVLDLELVGAALEYLRLDDVRMQGRSGPAV
jgi:hypothetical protein